MTKSKSKDGLKVVVFVVAAAVSIGVLAIQTLSSTSVYVATSNISSGKPITESMLSDGTIKKVSVPRALANASTIKNFEDIKGKFLKYPLGEGKMIFKYDFSSDSDMRNNEVLIKNNLEALSLNASSITNSVNSISNGDNINLYTVETIDLKTFSKESMIEVSKLPADIQKIFKEAGNLTDTDQINVGTYKYSKLVAQNLPVVEVKKDADTQKVTQFTIGVTPKQSEEAYLAIESGKVGVNILPYSEKTYKEKDSTGSLQNLQFVGASTDTNTTGSTATTTTTTTKK